MTTTPLDPEDLLLLTCAHRYALGRQTYMARVCIDRLTVHWGEFARRDRRDIVAETLEALLDDRAGHPRIDAPAWREFARWGWEQMEETQQMRVRDRLRWKLGARTVEAVLAEPAMVASVGGGS